MKQGRFELYNEAGQVMARAKFKNEKLHGIMKTYSNNQLVLKQKYRNGVEVKKRIRKENIQKNNKRAERREKRKIEKDLKRSKKQNEEPKKEKNTFWNKLFPKKKNKTA